MTRKYVPVSERQPQYIIDVNKADKAFLKTLDQYESYIGVEGIAEIVAAHEDHIAKTQWATYMSSHSTGRSPS